MESIDGPIKNVPQLLMLIGVICFFLSFSSAASTASDDSISGLALSISFGFMGMTAWMSGFQLYLYDKKNETTE